MSEIIRMWDRAREIEIESISEANEKALEFLECHIPKVIKNPSNEELLEMVMGAVVFGIQVDIPEQSIESVERLNKLFEKHGYSYRL